MEEKPFFMTPNEGFADIRPEDELLHPEANSRIADDSLTETQYLGFSVPEHNINAYGYLWHHPNLGVVSGGLFVYRGLKRITPQAELCDLRGFSSDRVLAGDLHDYTLDNGYRVQVREPLKRLHMSYADPERENSVDIAFEAVAPPVMFADGTHFEQPMRAKGELVLRGERFQVDCFNVRDRSWGKPRPENHLPIPPLSWVTGVFSENFMFNCTIMDHAGGNPDLAEPFQLTAEQALNSGWLYRDGKLGRITKAHKSLRRDRDTLRPQDIELTLADEHGRNIQLRGTLVASCPWQAWPNMNLTDGLVRWECEGLTTYGTWQDGIWNDFAFTTSA